MVSPDSPFWYTDDDPRLRNEAEVGDNGVIDGVALYTQQVASYAQPSGRRLKELFDNLTAEPAAESPETGVAAAAREEIIQSYAPIVASFADYYSYGELPPEDAIQEANLGLIGAVDRIVPRDKPSFRGYLARVSQGRVLNEGGNHLTPFQLPKNVATDLRTLRQYLADAAGDVTDVDTAALARDLGWSAERAATVHQLAMPVLSVEELRQAELASLEITREYMFGEDDPEPVYGQLGQIVEYDDPTADAALMVTQTDAVQGALAALDENDSYVVGQRLGITTDEPTEYAVIAENLGISRQWAAEIYERGLARLRHPTTSSGLVAYFYPDGDDETLRERRQARQAIEASHAAGILPKQDKHGHFIW